MSGLHRQLRLGRGGALKQLLLLLLILMLLLLLVHPGSGAIWVMRKTVAPLWWQVDGPGGKGLAWVVGAGALWAAGPHAREGLYLTLRVLVREGRVG